MAEYISDFRSLLRRTFSFTTKPNILMDLHKVFTHRLSPPSSLPLPPTASCGGVFSSEQGEVTSPNWPNNYLDQAVCTWRISIPSAKNIHIVFTHFEVQAVNQLGQCVDYVEIYGGAGLTSQGWYHSDNTIETPLK